MDMTRLRGIGVSPGIAMGEVLLAKRVVFTSRKEIIADDQVPDEIKRLHQALDRTAPTSPGSKRAFGRRWGPTAP